MESYVKHQRDVFAGHSILAIDDEPIIRELLNRLLKDLGFEHVECAADGSEALRKLDKSRFDLILCDIMMNPMNGIEFVRTLRKSAPVRYDSCKASTPVVFLSGSTEQEHIKGAKEVGVKGYIVKPIDAAIMRDRLAKFFRR